LIWKGLSRSSTVSLTAEPDRAFQLSEMDGMSAGAEGSGAAVPVLRTDAERNRKRIVDAARSVFRAEGLDASMASHACEAGSASPR
jgi:hypothetical protein